MKNWKAMMGGLAAVAISGWGCAATSQTTPTEATAFQDRCEAYNQSMRPQWESGKSGVALGEHRWRPQMKQQEVSENVASATWRPTVHASGPASGVASVSCAGPGRATY